MRHLSLWLSPQSIFSHVLDCGYAGRQSPMVCKCPLVRRASPSSNTSVHPLCLIKNPDRANEKSACTPGNARVWPKFTRHRHEGAHDRNMHAGRREQTRYREMKDAAMKPVRDQVNTAQFIRPNKLNVHVGRSAGHSFFRPFPGF